MLVPCIGAVAYAYSESCASIPQLSLSLNTGEIAEIIFTYTCGGKIYGDVPLGSETAYTWRYSVQSGNVTFLSFPGGTFQFIGGGVENCLTTTSQVTSLLQCNTTGTIALAVDGNVPRTCFTNSNWCLSGRVIAKRVNEPPSAPTTTVAFDPQNWMETVADLKGRTAKWVSGYQVRYAVSFYNVFGESAKGPWCEWIKGDPWALPTLTGLSLGQADPTDGRKLYRQFSGFDEELVLTVVNNTDTRCSDGVL